MIASIIITTHNRAETTLKNCSLPSAGNQAAFFDAREFEIIVVDDCSTDNTESVVEEFSKSHPRLNIKYVRNEKNQGPGACRNLGLKHSEGRYIAFLDDDDILVNKFLLMGTSVLDQFENKQVVIGQRVIMYPDGLKFEDVPVIKDKMFYITLDDGYLARREVFNKIQYDEEVYNEDADFGIQYMREFGKDGICTVNNVFFYKSGHMPVYNYLKEFIPRMEKYLDKNLRHYYEYGDKQELEYIFRMTGRLYLLAGFRKKGFQYLWKAYRTWKSPKSLTLMLYALGGVKFFKKKYQKYATKQRHY